MPVDAPLSAREVARLCHVQPPVVWQWIRQGKLGATRTHSGQYRIERAALRAFMQARGWVVPDELRPQGAQRVLVVDDESAAVEVLVRALQIESPKLEIATAGDGFVAGLQLATFRPDLLVLDLLMPQVDGFEVCRIVRHTPATAHVKILVVTAYGDHDTLRRAREAGANDVSLKPVDIEEFRAKARALLTS